MTGELKLPNQILDAHLHFGTTYQLGFADPAVYLKEARTSGITHAMVMPVPSPGQRLADDVYEWSCIRKLKPGVGIPPSSGLAFEYVRRMSNLRGTNITSDKLLVPGSNPYKTDNEQLLHFIKETNANQAGVSLSFVPLYHPILDCPEYVISLLRKPDVKALKIHTLATAATFEDIDSQVIEALVETGKPLIVHTDMFPGEITRANHWVMRNADPLKWINWGLKNNVRLSLAHGCRLNLDALRLASQHPNLIMVMISPGLLIETESDRLDHKPERSYEHDLMRAMLEYVGLKLAFDTDYFWNLKTTVGQSSQQIRPADVHSVGNYDWASHVRLLGIATQLGWTQDQVDQFFFKNGFTFYNID